MLATVLFIFQSPKSSAVSTPPMLYPKIDTNETICRERMPDSETVGGELKPFDLTITRCRANVNIF